MPLLGEEARELYEAAYGAEEYQRFCDNSQTFHGVIPVSVSFPVPPPSKSRNNDDKSGGNTDEDDSNREEDSGGEDSGGEDSGREDSGREDSGEEDSNEEDSGREDSDEEDSDREDSGEEDSGEEDLGKESSGEEDSGEEDSGEEDSGKVDEGKKSGKDAANSTSAAKSPEFHHRPEHDVESIFWVLVYTLIQANPRRSKKRVDKTSRSAYWQALGQFQNHTIHDNAIGDNRDIILRAAPETLEAMLHPELRSLSGMLVEMIAHINPEYGYLPNTIDESHLHEAMRRILLEQIVRMKEKPIPLRPGEPRPGPPPKTESQVQSQDRPEAKRPSKKRTREAEVAAGDTANKRAKSHSGTSTRRRQDMPTSLPGNLSYGRC